MDEKTTSTNASMEAKQQPEARNTEETKTTPSSHNTDEPRKAYGTAKTENLQDSGLWRLFIPGLIVASCLTIFIVPLLILIPLLSNSIEGILHNNPAEAGLLWVWITMIVVEVALGALITFGLVKAFLTQAGNYPQISKS